MRWEAFKGANSFLYELTPNEMGGKNAKTRVTSPESRSGSSVVDNTLDYQIRDPLRREAKLKAAELCPLKVIK